MGGTILLADDSITIQKVVELTFAETEHQVVAVSGGNELLRRVREVRPDVVVCDVVMPDLNGYEVCQTLKSDPATLHIPVVLLTGTFEPFDRDRALAVGCDTIVTKPFEARELIDVVEDLIQRSQLAGGEVGQEEPVAEFGDMGIPEGVEALEFTTTGFDAMVPPPVVEPTIPEEGIELTDSALGRPVPQPELPPVEPSEPVESGSTEVFTAEEPEPAQLGSGEVADHLAEGEVAPLEPVEEVQRGFAFGEPAPAMPNEAFSEEAPAPGDLGVEAGSVVAPEEMQPETPQAVEGGVVGLEAPEAEPDQWRPEAPGFALAEVQGEAEAPEEESGQEASPFAPEETPLGVQVEEIPDAALPLEVVAEAAGAASPFASGQMEQLPEEGTGPAEPEPPMAEIPVAPVVGQPFGPPPDEDLWPEEPAVEREGVPAGAGLEVEAQVEPLADAVEASPGLEPEAPALPFPEAGTPADTGELGPGATAIEPEGVSVPEASAPEPIVEATWPQPPVAEVMEPEAPVAEVMEPEAPVAEIMEPEAPVAEALEPEASVAEPEREAFASAVPGPAELPGVPEAPGEAFVEAAPTEAAGPVPEEEPGEAPYVPDVEASAQVPAEVAFAAQAPALPTASDELIEEVVSRVLARLPVAEPAPPASAELSEAEIERVARRAVEMLPPAPELPAALSYELEDAEIERIARRAGELVPVPVLPEPVAPPPIELPPSEMERVVAQVLERVPPPPAPQVMPLTLPGDEVERIVSLAVARVPAPPVPPPIRVPDEELDRVAARVVELVPALQAPPQPAPSLAGHEPDSAEVDRIARRALELAGPMLEKIAWEVLPDLAEMLVRKRIAEIEAAAESEN